MWVFFYKYVPLTEEGQFGRWWRFVLLYYKQVSLKLLEEGVATDIVHGYDTEHGGELGETPASPDTLLHDFQMVFHQAFRMHLGYVSFRLLD